MAQKKTIKNIEIINELTVYNVKELYNEIKKHISRNNHIQLDLKEIRQLDITGIQLIHALKSIPGKTIEVNCTLEESLDKLLTKTSIKETLN
jgi:ABC-type transporter Mla MlaB component